ncbi:hypothetical protein AVEN_90688-1 [Araneus ventricosus]|uniref:Uncharacterized protein n=1 Tax=Araneus ventricosus TaxID=182803 RepID=A0A4Y2UMF3_ARAVE|nr:hypothetical protein AVEN_274805-1 [Araneus ventricosus]GBO12856.1 hypothetical protein AVEN_90688-1 [Araneus ventricosus]
MAIIPFNFYLSEYTSQELMIKGRHLLMAKRFRAAKEAPGVLLERPSSSFKDKGNSPPLLKTHIDSWYCPSSKKTLLFSQPIWASHSNEESAISG